MPQWRWHDGYNLRRLHEVSPNVLLFPSINLTFLTSLPFQLGALSEAKSNQLAQTIYALILFCIFYSRVLSFCHYYGKNGVLVLKVSEQKSIIFQIQFSQFRQSPKQQIFTGLIIYSHKLRNFFMSQFFHIIKVYDLLLTGRQLTKDFHQTFGSTIFGRIVKRK